jgi:hypothetical protein
LDELDAWWLERKRMKMRSWVKRYDEREWGDGEDSDAGGVGYSGNGRGGRVARVG